LPQPFYREEFAESLRRSRERRAQTPPHPALLPRRERLRWLAIWILIVTLFALPVIAALIHGGP
jgi:hypothetical protein